ncbi:MAG TPA: MFS transporter [Pseudolabrys sp.]|uniref:MFS transporter n=1 Tax=Pseudolabrys sp. TaxID=1960880 RepID=UPI002DDD1F8E|nr:MFS transporter [Pseudolabrys sp.]HEV2629594.1 MFS transporter [Pseudolabrys sp.]
MTAAAGQAPVSDVESSYAWLRLAVAVALATVGGVGMWSVVVALPAIQADFGVDRAAASLPYTLAMLGFAGGGVIIGRLADRFGILPPLILGILSLGAGYIGVGLSPSLTLVAFAHTLLGFGCSATFGPLMADISHWFERRRGIAVAIAAAGNYIAGTVWPPLVQHFIATQGWRATHIGIGLFCLAVMLPLSLPMRRRLAAHTATAAAARPRAVAPFSPPTLQMMLCVAGVACCVAMAMPQVHIVAYCGDLGYGVARGAEMLSLMLGCGIVSRIASGFIADRIGGVRTLLLGSLLQGAALVLYLLFDSLFSLYVVSALFGLFQGGIVPSYAIIVREYFPPKEAGTRVGLVLMATLVGMALGGWMSGAIFDLTGSYQAAFLNGLAWNLVNVSIVSLLLLRSRRANSALAAA